MLLATAYSEGIQSIIHAPPTPQETQRIQQKVNSAQTTMSAKGGPSFGESRESWCTVERKKEQDWCRTTRKHFSEHLRSQVFSEPELHMRQQPEEITEEKLKGHRQRRHFPSSCKFRLNANQLHHVVASRHLYTSIYPTCWLK